MNVIDWNEERYRTRDRLLEYDFDIYPKLPHYCGLNIAYPWETITINQLSTQFIELLKQHGYTGTDEEIWNHFSNGKIQFGTITTFPIPGNEQNLYLDIETEILYCFKSTTSNMDI